MAEKQEDKVEEENEVENQLESVAEELDDADFFLGNEYYYEEKEFEKAIEHYKSVLESVEDDDIVQAKSLYWMGESYVKLHQFDKAIETFNQLIEEFDDHYLVESAKRRVKHLKEVYGG